MATNVHFFFNFDHSLLEFNLKSEEGQIIRLGFIDPAKGEAWYFDREPAETIQETSGHWFSRYGYCIQAADESTGTSYLYLYEYTP